MQISSLLLKHLLFRFARTSVLPLIGPSACLCARISSPPPPFPFPSSPPSVPSPLVTPVTLVTPLVTPVVVVDDVIIIRPPPHANHLCQDPGSISRTFLEQFVLVFIILLLRLCANYFPVTQEPFLTLMKFLSPGNRVVPSRRLTGTMFWKCFCHLQEFKSLVSFTSQLSQMFREDQWEWWGDEGPVWEHVRQVPWKPGKVSSSELTICNHFFLYRMLRSRLATYSDHSLLSNRFFLCQNMNYRR